MNTDYSLIENLKNSRQWFSDICNQIKIIRDGVESVAIPSGYPLDNEIFARIDEIRIEQDDDEYRIYKYRDVVCTIWEELLRKSIICLRYFDSREPFQKKPDKYPHAYGMPEMSAYFEKYTEFESVLYGGARFYRDHVMHVFRVWLLGITILLKDNCIYLNRLSLEGGLELNCYEKISIWTIASLTHDLGYPLEKATQILERTNNMMKSFVSNPCMSLDLSFSGVQNSMNDFVLRFISSKMKKVDDMAKTEAAEQHNQEEIREHEPMYVARLQPKYYFKLQKSLENHQHGVLSTLIVYKLLTYFLESDYSINEDYQFDEEGVRQFYIRREILRSVASHTCRDIYQNTIDSFSFLLLVCDDAQEWGRKSMRELYTPNKVRYQFEALTLNFQGEGNPICEIKDKQDVTDNESLLVVLKNIILQSGVYRNVFRDGLDTISRNFSFKRIWKIDYSDLRYGLKSYVVSLIVSSEKQTFIEYRKDDGGDISVDDVIFQAFDSVCKKSKLAIEQQIINNKVVFNIV